MAEHFLDAKKKVVTKQNKGEHSGIKYIGDVNRYNVEAARKFLDAGVQLRHLKIPPQMSFSISDKQIVTTIDSTEGDSKIQSLLISDDPTYLNHFKSIFEGLWGGGIDARIILSDFEDGKETDYELTFAKNYLNEVMVEISNMKNNAKQRGIYVPSRIGLFWFMSWKRRDG
jgi:hypothetical protein